MRNPSRHARRMKFSSLQKKCILYSRQIGTIASSVTRINGCLCDSEKEKKIEKKEKWDKLIRPSVYVLFLLPQLIPEAYCLTTPLLFPFPPTSRNVLGVNVVHGIVEDARLVSSQHVLSNGCCWFARTGHAITRIPDDLVVRAADYQSRRLDDIAKIDRS